MVEVANTTNRGAFNTIGGNVVISGGVTFDPDLRTLTCISTGGPATTVTWTRDSTTVTEGTETVLNDPVTANYTHTLNITTEGVYTCNVTNNKPSTTSANITLGIVNTCQAYELLLYYIFRVFTSCWCESSSEWSH